MTIEEFGKQIKTKYPQYQSVDDAELGNKMIAKYPQYKAVIKDNVPPQATDTFLEGHPILKGISDFVGTTGLARGAAQGIFLKYTEAGKKLLDQVAKGEITVADVEKIIGRASTTKEILASAGQTALTIAAFGQPQTAAKDLIPAPSMIGRFGTETGKVALNEGFKGFAKSATGQALQSGTLVGTGSALGAYGEGKSGSEIAGAGAGGFALGAGFSLAGAAIKAGLKGIPKLLSMTSEVPEEVLNRSFKNPELMGMAQKSVRKAGESGTLKGVQGAVRQLRGDLSTQYDEGKKLLIQAFPEQRFGLNEKEAKSLNKIIDTFGKRSTEIPKDLTEMSVNEGLSLYKNLNELKRGTLKFTPEGASIRKFVPQVREKLIETFGGKNGPVDSLLKNYGAKKTVHDAMDILVKAYKTSNPQAQSSALSAVKKVFTENKGAFVDAIKEFEQLTGKRVLDQFGALTTQNVFPKRTGGFGFDEIFRMAILPLTSPRLVGATTRLAGRLAETGGGQTAEFIKGVGKKLLYQ